MKETASDFLSRFDPWAQRVIDGMPQSRKGVFVRFLEEAADAGLSIRTLQLYVNTVRGFNGGGKPFRQISEQEVREWARALDQSYSPDTAWQRKKYAVKFLRWVHTGGFSSKQNPACVAWIRRPPMKQDLGRDILTPDEVRRMVGAAKTQRDRALIFALYETGARSSEILGMKLKDLEFDRYGAVLRIGRGPHAKTGERRVRVFESVPDLQLWTSMHPDKGNPEAPLWPRMSMTRGYGISHSSLWLLVKDIARRAGIGKKISPHSFRHSRATVLAQVLKEHELKIFFGWSKKSDMPSTYIHLAGADVDRTLMEHYGITPRGELGESPLKTQVCPRCRTENSVSAKFCWKCWAPLEKSDELTAKVIEAMIRKAPELLAQVLKEEGLDREISEVARGGVKTGII